MLLVDPSEMAATNRSVIYFLHASLNDDRYSPQLMGPSPRNKGMPLGERTLSDDCPEGVWRVSLPPISDWAAHLGEPVFKFRKDVPHELPDRVSVAHGTIISARCRDTFERIDPDGGHIYLPTKIHVEGGGLVEGEWYYMWCGRFFVIEKAESQVGELFADEDIDYQSERGFADPRRRAFFEDIPIWTFGSRPGPTFLTQSVFSEVKSASLTGFREYTARHGAGDFKRGVSRSRALTTENVSHIWF